MLMKYNLAGIICFCIHIQAISKISASKAAPKPKEQRSLCKFPNIILLSNGSFCLALVIFSFPCADVRIHAKWDKTTASRERTPWEQSRTFIYGVKGGLPDTSQEFLTWTNARSARSHTNNNLLAICLLREKERECQACVSVGGMELGDEPSHVAVY